MDNGLVVVACPNCGGLELLIVPSQAGVQVKCVCGLSGPFGAGPEGVQDAVKGWARLQFDRRPEIAIARAGDV